MPDEILSTKRLRRLAEGAEYAQLNFDVTVYGLEGPGRAD
jgi:hypothetical protein